MSLVGGGAAAGRAASQGAVSALGRVGRAVRASLAPRVASKTMLRRHERPPRAGVLSAACLGNFSGSESVSVSTKPTLPAPGPCDAATVEYIYKRETKETSKRVDVASSLVRGRALCGLYGRQKGKGGMPSSHTSCRNATSCLVHRTPRAHACPPQQRSSPLAHTPWPAASRNGARFVARTRTRTDSRECARGARIGGCPAAAATRAQTSTSHLIAAQRNMLEAILGRRAPPNSGLPGLLEFCATSR